MVGWELLGAALDELLPLHEGDAAVTPSVLRASLRKIGDGLRATATNLVVSAADMFEVRRTCARLFAARLRGGCP